MRLLLLNDVIMVVCGDEDFGDVLKRIQALLGVDKTYSKLFFF